MVDVQDRGRTYAAFDELARIALAEYETGTAAQRIARLAEQALPGSVGVSMTVLREDRPTTVAATGSLPRTLDQAQYDAGEGPCVSCAQTGVLSDVRDTATDRRWPAYASAAVTAGVGSSLSVPVPVRAPGRAALNVYGARPGALDGARELAASFASYAAVALTSVQLYGDAAALHAQLEQAVRSRAVIDQAKGILMAQRRCSAEEAFDVLVQMSQRSNRKLRDIARSLVDSTVEDA